MIYESILTSLSCKGEAHIAPFGVREHNGLVLIAPFRPSVTLDNLLSTRQAVLNFTDDVRPFAGGVTGRHDWPLTNACKINGVVLASALTHQELELVEVKDDQTRPELYCRIVHEEIHAAFRGFNRAQAAVIELAVLVSRLHMLPIEKIETEINYLRIAVEKTAGERELEAWQWLIDKVENHKAAMTGDNQA
ncbi:MULTISPECIES: DUF447 domain-containing protein [Methylobacillus]|uniref:Protein involved in biosynthesis of tetrahydromethanopterin, Orf19 n=1 Tax=Methylobacillus flagellatus (strain ATCC 51484 / DSM 6875 / VKM B-1610 / KT) TaxID=265072 RepID=Q1H0Y9_METFK|nr:MULTISPECIES: DUF447 domain-containing protein [Methylobacillus]ABE49848.1 Protein involved in biosynthesis of tetrahydromethanopterin, Orf19 [Methylobacillus flagellatus KT]MPS48926.1 DUF447 family protein [Methylobacillus sp.]